MGFSDYLENKLGDHLFRGQSWASPTVLYFALFNGDPTDTGAAATESGLARVAVTTGLSAFTGTHGSTIGPSGGSGGGSPSLTFPGVEAEVTRSNWSNTVPWVHFNGDWKDKNNISQSVATGYETSVSRTVISAGVYRLDLAIKDLVVEWLTNGNRGVMIWGSQDTFSSRQHANPAVRPNLIVTRTDNSTVQLPCTWDTELDSSTISPRGLATNMQVYAQALPGGGYEKLVALQFDLTNCPPAAGIQSAVLQLFTEGSSNTSTVYRALLLDPPISGSGGGGSGGTSGALGAVTNATPIVFTGNWIGTVAYVAVMDAASGGNMLLSAPLTTAFNVTSVTGPPQFPVGAFQFFPDSLPPPPGGGGGGGGSGAVPISADFLGKQPRISGGDSAFSSFKRLPNGKGITFGGYSHDRKGTNSVVEYDTFTDTWSVLKAHTTWVDIVSSTPGFAYDALGLSFLGNRDNHPMLVEPVSNKLWVFDAERGVDINGNYSGVFSVGLASWTEIHDTPTWPNITVTGDTTTLGRQITAACGWHATLNKGYLFGGARVGNHSDSLTIFTPNIDNTAYTAAVYYKLSGQSFTGSQRLRQVTNSHFTREGVDPYVYIYAGDHWQWDGTIQPNYSLWRIDLVAVTMQLVSVNTVLPPDRVQGEAMLTYYDPEQNMMVATSGSKVNVYMFGTNTWHNVPVNTPADPFRTDYGAGYYAPEIKQAIIEYRQSRVYGLRMNYGSPITVTEIPLTGDGAVLGGSTKHLDFAKVGSKWYKMCGDHAKLSTISPDPQGGRQEILSLDLATNTWVREQEFFLPASFIMQLSTPDDAFCAYCPPTGEIFVWVSSRNNVSVAPPGSAIQNGTDVCAWNPVTKMWRAIAPTPISVRNGSAWDAVWVPEYNEFFIPAYNGGSGGLWVRYALNGTTSVTGISGGPRVHIAGVALAPDALFTWDSDNNVIYRTDRVTLTSAVWGTLTQETPNKSDQSALSIFYVNGQVVCFGDKMHVMKNGVEVVVQDRPDGYLNSGGQFIGAARGFVDGSSIYKIGTIDFNLGSSHGFYWKIDVNV